CAAFHQAEKSFVYIANLLDGVDQYSFPDFGRVRCFTISVGINCPIQVSTAQDGAWVVCGGTNGSANIFNAATGDVLQELVHDSGTQYCSILIKKQGLLMVT
ncbi:hypothetical protein SCHPADRAFT_841146, partial [Schizopora paradoxa]